MTEEIPMLDLDASPTLDAIISADPRVSSTSRWSSDVWTIDGELGGRTAAAFRIHWGVAAPRRLKDEAKLLAAYLFLAGGEESDLGPSTTAGFSAGIRHLLRFMTTYAYSSFDQLDADAFAMFVKYLPIRLADPEWWAEEPADQEVEDDDLVGSQADHGGRGHQNAQFDLGDEPDGDIPTSRSDQDSTADAIEEGDELTRASAYFRLRIWRQLYRYSSAMGRAGAGALPADPFASKSIWTVTKEVSSIASQLIPPLPDPVALKIMARAHRLIGIPADDVLRLQHKYIDCRERLLGEVSREEAVRIRLLINRFEFSKMEGSPWHGPIGGGRGSAAIKELVDLVRDAAVLIIFCGTGVRISELCSLAAGPTSSAAPLPLFGQDAVEPENLPHCVSTSVSKTGLNEHLFMHGKLYKNHRKARDEKWLIGARPRGDEAEPPVLRAIRVLEQLYAPWRAFSTDPKTQRQLILSFYAAGFPASPGTVRQAGAGTLRTSLRRFIEGCGLEELAPTAETDVKLRPYVETRGRCIRPHQWRKTFALYMMKVDDRMVPALARHFKHMTIAVTENSYMPKDPSMLAAQDSVHAQEAAKWFYEQRHGAGGTFGRLDEIMAEHREEWEKLVSDLPFEEVVPEVRRYCLERDIRIFHAEHGRCVIAANPDKARCHEVAGTTSWRNSRPNHLTRTAPLCTGCANFTVSAEHAGYWRRRYIDNESSWRGSDRTAQFRVVQKQAQQAAQVLKALGVPLPVILVEAPSDRARRRGPSPQNQSNTTGGS